MKRLNKLLNLYPSLLEQGLENTLNCKKCPGVIVTTDESNQPYKITYHVIKEDEVKKINRATNNPDSIKIFLNIAIKHWNNLDMDEQMKLMEVI